jgi:hypothetical protein
VILAKMVQRVSVVILEKGAQWVLEEYKENRESQVLKGKMV